MRSRSVTRTVRRRLNRVLLPAEQALAGARGEREGPIWVVGDGRSGTTWLANVINHDHGYRYLFEPFHPDYVGATAAFAKYQYVRPDDDDPRFVDAADRVFSGRLYHHRVDKLARGLTFRGLLVKDIYAHLFLRWATRHFPAVRPVLLLRHPFAIALSKIDRPTWNWVRDPVELWKQDALRDDFLAPYGDVIKGATTEFERHVVVWSIIHHVPLRQFEAGQVLLVFYEQLQADPHSELRRVMDYLHPGGAGGELGPGVLAQLDRASETTGAGAGGRNRRGIDDWKQRVSPEDAARGLAVLAAFGLDAVYGDAPMPDADAAHRLLAAT